MSMSSFWRVFVGLAIVLPIAAYVVGSLTVSAADDPAPPAPVRIADPTETPALPDERTTRANDDDDARDDDADDNEVRVVTPQPTRVDGDDGDDRPEGDDDDSGGGDSDDDSDD